MDGVFGSGSKAREEKRAREEIVAPFPFVVKPAAKSSTWVLKASVCQRCGCKLDGLTLKRACDCRCHKDGPR